MKRPRKGTDGLVDRIEDLERRVRELEARPPQILPVPVYVQPPVVVPAPPNTPYWNPYPWIVTTCGQFDYGNVDSSVFGANAVAPTYPDFSETPQAVFTTGPNSGLS